MLKTTRTLITASLAAILFGGVISPSVVHADSTVTPADTTVTTKAADTKSTFKVSSIELPYILVSDKDGNTKLRTYPNLPASLTVNQINDPDYMAKLVADHPEIDDNFTSSLTDTIETFKALDPNKSFIDLQMDSSGTQGMTKDEALNSVGLGYYIQAWAISKIAQNMNHQTDYDTINAEYLKTIRPKLAASALADRLLTTMDGVFDHGENYFNIESPYVYASFTGNTGLAKHYSTEKLSQLDPDASYRQIVALYTKPISSFFKKQADGTYQVDGILLAGLMAYSFWFEDTPNTPNPTPTPAISQPVTVHYVDDQGKTLKADKVLAGKLGESYQTTRLDINGYAVTKTTGEESGTFGSTAKSVTYTYSAVLSNGGAAATIAPKGTVVYATKKIGLYKNATFTKKARKQWYAKQKRINRPMFVVTGYAKSQNGIKRYRVKDVNHHSKTDGLTGYITANAKYTQRVYYAAKHQKVTVINPQGVNAYGKKNLTNKKTHYQRGQVLKVKKIVNHNLTTRFVLSNGTYVTANKRLVKALN